MTELTDEQYRQAVDWCRHVVDADRSTDGGPLVAGSFLGALRELLATTERAQPRFEEWCLFWGGPDPDNCAGFDTYDDEVECEERVQYMGACGYARRTVYAGSWRVVWSRPTPEDGG